MKEGDKVDYKVPSLLLKDHEPFEGLIITDIIRKGDLFVTDMCVCKGSENGWMPMNHITFHEE